MVTGETVAKLQQQWVDIYWISTGHRAVRITNTAISTILMEAVWSNVYCSGSDAPGAKP